MVREMRRKKQLLSQEKCEEILKRGTSGVLSLCGDDDYPYGVPLSYVYHDHKIIFHSAKRGHKIDAIEKNNKVSFCVIDQDQIIPKELTTYFRSVIVFGRAFIIHDEDKKRIALQQLGEHYAPHHEGIQEEIDNQISLVTLIEIQIDQITGKEAIELININKKG